ncbi:decaprenyl-phosphate phosphoribosyltransferase, partial [Mycobacterium tuberculosis]
MRAAVVPPPPAPLVAGVVPALRPRPWVPPVLVLAAPLAALGGGVL